MICRLIEMLIFSILTKYFRSSNYWKYSIGQKGGLEKLNVKAKKEDIEARFNKWVIASPDRKEKYGDALNMIKTATEGRAEHYNAYQYVTECIQGCELFSMNQVSRILINALRQDDNQKVAEAVSRVKSYVKGFYKDYNLSTDKKSTSAMLKLYRSDIPERFHPDYYANIIDKKYKGDIDKFVDDMFAKTVFSSESKLMAFLDKPVLKTIENDLVYLASASVYKIAVDISDGVDKFDDQLNDRKKTLGCCTDGDGS